jgi:hypothetical protein
MMRHSSCKEEYVNGLEGKKQEWQENKSEHELLD